MFFNLKKNEKYVVSNTGVENTGMSDSRKVVTDPGILTGLDVA